MSSSIVTESRSGVEPQQQQQQQHSPLQSQSLSSHTSPEIGVNASGDNDMNISMEPLGELDGAINSLATGVKYNLTQLSPKQLLLTRWRLMKSWGSFFDTNKMVFPTSIQQWSRRLLRNLHQFQSNYLCVSLILVIYCILTSPLLLLALATSVGAGYIVTLKNAERPIKFFGRKLTLGQQYLAIGLCSLPLFYVVGAGSAVFWVIGATLFFVGLHASVYAIESLVDSLDDETPFNFSVQSI